MEDIKKFAAKSPDRWSQGLTISSRLAGYKTDTPLTINNILVNMGSMSDAELQHELNRRMEAMKDITGEAGPPIEQGKEAVQIVRANAPRKRADKATVIEAEPNKPAADLSEAKQD